MSDRTKHCCCCGELRKPTQQPVGEYSNRLAIVRIHEHRELKPGRWEERPQLLVGVTVRRNGGTDYGNTHICDGCIVVGLREAKRFVDESLAALGDSP